MVNRQGEFGWIDQSVAGGDRLREEWREACKHENKGDASETTGSSLSSDS